LTYRQPSFLEGFVRIFDVLGMLKDDSRVYPVYSHHKRTVSVGQSGFRRIASPENVGTKSINLAFRKIHQNMGFVAGKMRSSISTHNHPSIFK
jgi:hypothetical protein